MMKWKLCGRKQSGPNMRYQTWTHLVGLRKTTKTLNKNWNLSRDLNLYHPEHAVT
jgi:hypothetical protein